MWDRGHAEKRLDLSKLRRPFPYLTSIYAIMKRIIFLDSYLSHEFQNESLVTRIVLTNAPRPPTRPGRFVRRSPRRNS